MTVKILHMGNYWNERKEENKNLKDASGMSHEFIIRFETYISLQKNTDLQNPRANICITDFPVSNVSTCFLYKQSCNIKGNGSTLGDLNTEVYSQQIITFYFVKGKLKNPKKIRAGNSIGYTMMMKVNFPKLNYI